MQRICTCLAVLVVMAGAAPSRWLQFELVNAGLAIGCGRDDNSFTSYLGGDLRAVSVNYATSGLRLGVGAFAFTMAPMGPDFGDGSILGFLPVRVGYTLLRRSRKSSFAQRMVPELYLEAMVAPFELSSYRWPIWQVSVNYNHDWVLAGPGLEAGVRSVYSPSTSWTRRITALYAEVKIRAGIFNLPLAPVN